jgi:hypothetical protein
MGEMHSKLRQEKWKGRPSRRWKYINTGVKEVVFEGMYWIHLAQDMERLVVGFCEHDDQLWVPCIGVS